MKTLAVVLLALAGLGPAAAKPKVAILNVQKAILSTADGKAAAAGLKRKFAAEEASLSEEQREISRLQAQLREARAEEDIGSLRHRIDALTTQHRRRQDDARAKVEAEQKRVLNDLAARLLVVVGQYAKQKHFEVILDESDVGTPVYWRAERVDITEEVIKRYESAAKQRPAPPPAP